MKLSRLLKVGLAMLALSFSLQTIASYQDEEISRPKWSSGVQLVLENQSAEKIAAHKGELSLNYVDYSIPGVNGLDINIHRNYNISELQGFGPFSGIEAWAGPNHGGTVGPGWQIMAAPIIQITWYSGHERYYPGMDPICYGQSPSYPAESGGGNYTIHSLQLPNGEVRALHRSNLLPRVETPDGWVLTCTGGAYTLWLSSISSLLSDTFVCSGTRQAITPCRAIRSAALMPALGMGHACPAIMLASLGGKYGCFML